MKHPAVSYASMTKIDLTDHGGLRGLLSIWIVVFHCLIFDKHPIDVQGSSLMPFFFLLSGFSLTIGYYRKFLPTVSSDDPKSETLNKPISWFSFMYGRLVRVLPVYYICFLLCLPPFFAGFGAFNPDKKGEIAVSVLTTILPINTWLAGFGGAIFDGPAWTITTLVGLWLFFPGLLAYYSRLSDADLLQSIRTCYWVQFWLLIVLFAVTLPTLGIWPALAISTMNPLSRLPVFAMGVAAGVLCLRYPSASGFDAMDRPVVIDGTSQTLPLTTTASFVTTGSMPWFHDAGWYLPLFCCQSSCCCADTATRRSDYRAVNTNMDHESLLSDPGLPLDTTSIDHPPTSNADHSAVDGNPYFMWYNAVSFQRVLDQSAWNLLTATVATIIVDTVDRYIFHGQGILGAVWLQALNPFAQLTLLVALTRHQTANTVPTVEGSEHPQNSVSIVVRLLRHPVLQSLGTLSMSVYLVHWVLAYYVNWARFGRRSLAWPENDDYTCDDFDENTVYYSDCEETLHRFIHYMTWPDWIVLVLPFLSIVAGYVLHRGVEVPVQRYFR